MINMFSNNLDSREASKFCSHENRAINNNKKRKKIRNLGVPTVLRANVL